LTATLTAEGTGLSRAQCLTRYRIFAVTWLAYAGFYFCRKNLSVAIPALIEDLRFTKEGLAGVVFGYHLLYLIGQFVHGPLADRWGGRLIVGIGLAVAVCANIAMGLAATLGMFLVLNCVNGFAQATGWPGLVKNLSAWFGHRERGIVMAWWGTCYILGSYLATLAATAFLSSSVILPGLGWKRAFFGPAIILTVFAAAYIVYTRNRPTDAGLPEIVDQDEIPGRAAGHEGGETSIIREVLAEPAVWIVGFSYFFLKLTRYSLLYWLPLYLVEHLRYSKVDAGITSSYYELAGFGGAIAAGYISDKLFQSRRFPVGAILLLGLAAAFLLQVKLSQSGIFANAAGLCLLGFLTFGPDTLVTGAGAMDLGTKRGAATAVGVINGIGSAGQLLSPVAVVWVAGRFGWSSLFYLFSLCSAVSALLLATKWNFRGRAAS
jgi:MFS transporter, OPA family, sugar phosphate sensor protein UhpC